MECPRGWMIAKNKDGINVPFLIKVRNSDIYYSSTVSGKYQMAGVFTESQMKDMDVTIIPPGQTYMMTIDKWYCWLNNNETFDIGTIITMDSIILSEDHTKLTAEITFPWKVVYKNILNMTITKECAALDLKLSHFNIVMGDVSSDGDVERCTLELFKHDGSAFEDSCLTDSEYRNSKIRFGLTAMVSLGEYSQIDTKENIGVSWDPSANLIGSGSVLTRQEVEEMINNLRHDIETGQVITPRDIMDLVNDPIDAAVLNNGYILDIDEDSAVVHTDDPDNSTTTVNGEEVDAIDLSKLGL